MRELFDKYLNNQCSPEEVKELLTHFNVAENEDTLRKLIIESLENIHIGDENKAWTPHLNESFDFIKKQLAVKHAKVVPLMKTTVFRVAVALAIVVAGYAVYNLAGTTLKRPNIAKVDPLKDVETPGTDRATLTLQNGSTILLETAVNGELSVQGNSKITKAKQGQLIYTSLNEVPKSEYINSIVTPRGGQYQVILSDGTKVWLNAASSLRYPATFAGIERAVELMGEGYFEVAKNVTRPFKVKFGGKGEIEVLGTHFNVSSYNDEAIVNITLLEGKVKVSTLTTNESTIINPGEQAQLNHDGLIQINKNADTEQAVAWKNGAFNFDNADLGMVLRQISRWYDVDIVYEDTLPKRQFGGEMQRDLKLPQVLELLEKNHVHCRLEGSKLTILK